MKRERSLIQESRWNQWYGKAIRQLQQIVELQSEWYLSQLNLSYIIIRLLKIALHLYRDINLKKKRTIITMKVACHTRFDKPVILIENDIETAFCL